MVGRKLIVGAQRRGEHFAYVGRLERLWKLEDWGKDEGIGTVALGVCERSFRRDG